MYFIIIRGPAGVGKTTIANHLTKKLHAYHLSFDKIMSKKKLDIIKGSGIPSKNFIKANEIALNKIKNIKKKVVIFDGCFYRKRQLTHLLKNLHGECYIFSLKAPVKECIIRNKIRKGDMSKKAIHDVYKLTSKEDHGTIINTSRKTIDRIVKEIITNLSN